MATQRQINAIQKLSENIRNPLSKQKSLGKILKDVGYSDSVSKSPQRVTETKGWNFLINKYFPEEYLLKVHKKILSKKEIVTHQGSYIKTDQPHSDVKYALEMLYRLKGMFKEYEGLSSREIDELLAIKKEKEEFDDLTDEELETKLDRLKKERRYHFIKEAREKLAK